MSILSDTVKGLTSRRVRDVPDPEPPTTFEQYGGWSNATDAASAALDPAEDERTARRAGAAAMLALEAQRLERAKAAQDAQLAGVRRGVDYSKGFGG